jgi:Zn-dependent protease with chaperone function
VSVIFLLLTPLQNSIIRSYEAEADAFGLNAAREPYGWATAAMRLCRNGGEGEIRTHEPREGPPVFKTGAINRSATSPYFARLAVLRAGSRKILS